SPKTVPVDYSISYDDYAAIQDDIGDYEGIVIEPLWAQKYKIDPQPTSDTPTAYAKETSDNGATWADAAATYQWYNFDPASQAVGSAVSGATSNTLSSGIDGNYYVCKVTFENGDILTTDAVQCVISSYTVSFNANGGSGSMADVESPIGEEYTLPDCTFTAPSGMEFAGWDKGQPGDKITLTDNTTLTAQWQSIYKDYAILQNDINHVREVVGSIADVTEKDGKIVIKLKSDVTGRIRFDNNAGSFLLDLNGHTITPGNQNEALCLDNNFTGTVTVTGEGTLKKGKNNIVYNWKGTLNFAVAEGSEYFSLKNGDDNVFAEKNTTTKNYSGTFSSTGDGFVLTQGTLGTYTVYFDANGGSGSMANQTIKELTPTELSANTFTLDGYTFKGWSTRSGDVNVDYADREKVTDLAPVGGEAQLFAVWEIIPAAAPSVSTSSGLNLTYGDIDASDTISVLATANASTYDLSYQWYRGESKISGATSSSYTIPQDTEAGSYIYYCNVTATRKDNGENASTKSAYIIVNVEKATPVITVDTTPIVKTYGEVWSLPTATSDYGTVTTNKTVADMKNAATYTVTYSVSGTNNWNSATKTISVTINPAKVDKPSADTTVFTYDRSEKTYTIAANSLYTVSNNKRTNAGSQTVTVALKDKTNYTWADGKTADLAFTFTIGKAQAAINVDTTPIVKTYGEALTLPTATTNFGTVTADKTVADMKNAGTYTVTYTVAGTDNWVGDTKTLSVTINKKPVSIAWGETSFVYDGSEKTVTAEISNAESGDTVTPTLSGNTGTSAGDYTATVTALSNDNYTLDGVAATKAWKIAQATNEWTSELSISDWTYGDTPNAPQALAKFGTVNFAYSDAEDGVYETEVPTEAGVWYVRAEVSETTDFTGLSATKSFEIEKAIPSASEAPKATAVVIGRALNTSTIIPGVILGIDGVTELSGTYSWKNGNKILDKKGEYNEVIIFTPKDSSNYEAVEFEVTVNAAYLGGLYADGDKTKPQTQTPSQQQSGKLFDDVPVGSWYEEAAEWMGKNGYMSGTAGRTFSPNLGTSRGMIVTILWRIAGSPEPQGECPFEDVNPGSYYEKAITWAQENGVVTGHSDTIFKPDDLITREQLAAIIYRNEVRKGMDAVTTEENLTSFADHTSVRAYAVTAMNWAVGEGLLNGVGDNTLAPQKTATRAEAATMIYRMENK
ncbi:MAG: S-layer homology domain-containing protein, partial [Oscillospiraceae bacterium]|nr:S-layer homology domain-containing protein [Oscillospiraceae bacterium]